MNIKTKLVTLDNWLLLGLFAVTFYPLIYTGYLTADDAVRHLEVLSGGLFHQTWGIVEATGRITLFFHFVLTHIPYLVDNYLYRKIFLILPHIVVILLFSLVLYSYVRSKTVSIVFCTLFLSFFTNSWEHNLYGSYPFAFHASIASIILSGYYLNKYLVNLERKDLIISVAFYFVAIFTYEQFVVYFIFIVSQIFIPRRKMIVYSTKRSFAITLPFIISTVLFLSIFTIIKHVVPGSYPGTEFAIFDITRIAKTLVTFVASAFPLYVPFHYVDSITHGAASFNYPICFIWVVKAVIASILVVRTLSRSDYMSNKFQAFYQSLTLFLLILISVLLISLSAKYQYWVINSKALAYSSSSYFAQMFAAALVALLLTFASGTKIAKSFPLIFKIIVITCISYIVLVTEMHNSDVLAEQKNSANKWAAIDSLHRSGELNTIPSGSIIFAPNFINTGGIVNMHEGYWASFLALKYGVDLNITGEIYQLCNPSYISKRFELKYDSRYPHETYSAVIRKHHLSNFFAIIPDYERTGFYGIERDGNGRLFRWSKKSSSLIICNATDKTAALTFNATVQSDAERAQPLTICFLEHCNNYRLSSAPTEVKENYMVPPGYHHINFRTDAAAVNAPNETRSLYFTIRDFEINEN